MNSKTKFVNIFAVFLLLGFSSFSPNLATEETSYTLVIEEGDDYYWKVIITDTFFR